MGVFILAALGVFWWSYLAHQRATPTPTEEECRRYTRSREVIIALFGLAGMVGLGSFGIILFLTFIEVSPENIPVLQYLVFGVFFGFVGWVYSIAFVYQNKKWNPDLLVEPEEEKKVKYPPFPY